MVTCANCSPTVEVFNTPISIHWIWLIFYVLAVVGSLMANSIRFIVLVALLDGPILLMTIIGYELGAIMMLKTLGGTMLSIVIFPFLGIATFEHHNKGPSGDLRYALAGPLTFCAQGGVWFGLFWLASSGDMNYFNWFIYRELLEMNFFAVLFSSSVFLNIFLFIFHIIPAYPLAGGKILAAVMLMRKVEKTKVAMVTGKTGLFVVTFVFIYSLVAFFILREQTYSVLNFVSCIIIFWYCTALIKKVGNGTLDDHYLFISSSGTNENNGNAAAASTTVVAHSQTGQVPPATKNETEKKSWWKLGGKKKEQENKNDVEVDYGY